MPFEKSLYEMTNEELAELRPDDFTEAFIKSNDPLVEEWAKTPWLQDDRGGAIPGKTARERDYNRAVIARTLQNYVNEFLGYRGRNGQGQQVPLTVAESVDRMAKAAGAVDNQFPDYDKINEAASAATTSAWSGATTLPLVLGYARKIMPKMQALNLYAVQPLDRPAGRVFYIARNRDNNGTTDGQVEQRAGWSYRSWANDPGEATTITKAVTFTITSSDVSATGHKLLAQTSIEVEQDLRAYFGMDAVSLVSDIATDELAIELDEILVYNLYRQGSVNGVGTYQYGSTSFGATLPTGQTQESWDKRLLELVTRAATGVLNQKRVYPNWILGGTEWQIHLGNIAQWQTNMPELPMRTIVQPSGNVLGQFNLYTATMPFPVKEAIMGFKGSDYVDATAFYLPYIPLALTGVLFDPATQKRTLSWLTRYAIFNNAFSGQNQSYAYMKLTNALTGLSYPDSVEYT